ncbi:MAG: serine hydrolase [Alphaproteobacteria bacterium]|nr:serine hydrolase [Alphaproteobacteria bacterium]
MIARVAIAFLAGGLAAAPALSPLRAETKLDLSALDAIVEEAVSAEGLPGAAVTVVHRGETVYEKSFGAYTMDTHIPVASAGKWLTVATVLTLVDEGRIALDDPVEKYLPAFGGDKAAMTVRELMAVSSGLPRQYLPIYNTEADFDEVVNGIAGTTLEAPPGTKLIYGGLGFHVAGGVATAVTGKSWHELFGDRVAGPLGMTRSVFGRRDPKAGMVAEPASNPWLGGGLVTTMRDYKAFMDMVMNAGMAGGKRVLSEAMIRELRTNQTRGLPVAFTLHPDRETPYALGAWVESEGEDGLAVKLRDMGAWGFNPWFDFGRGYYAIFGVYKDKGFVGLWPYAKRIEAEIDRAIDARAAQAERKARSAEVLGSLVGGIVGTAAAAEASETRLQKIEIETQGVKRVYYLYVPSSYDLKKPGPVVVGLPRSALEGPAFLQQGGWDRKADKEGFLLVLGEGRAFEVTRSGKKTTLHSFNDGSDRYPGGPTSDVDVVYLGDVLDDVAARVPYDKDRVYIAGFAIGTSMALFAATQGLGPRLAAVGAVTGHMWDEAKSDPGLPPLIAISGTDDPINPMKEGLVRITTGTGVEKPSPRTSVQRYARTAGLSLESTLAYLGDGLYRETYGPNAEGCEVVFYFVQGLGHQWAGMPAQGPDYLGPSTDRIDATDMLWDFFKSHSRKH